MPAVDSTKRFWKGLLQIADPKIWVASVMPFFLGQVLAYSYAKKSFEWLDLWWILCAFIALGLIETGKNAANECVDYLSGVDRFVDREHRTPFSGGKKTIVDGLLSLEECALIAAVTFFLAGLVGLYIVFFRQITVLYIGMAGLLLSAFYSLPPFKLCYRGLGELTVGVTFGPLVVMGSYVMTSGRLDTLPLLASLVTGFLIANVLWINQYPDYEADKAGNKRNLVVRLGKKRAVWGYGALFVCSYLSAGAVAVYARNPVWLLPALTAYNAYQAVKNCRENYDNMEKLLASNAVTVRIYAKAALLLAAAAVLDGFLF